MWKRLLVVVLSFALGLARVPGFHHRYLRQVKNMSVSGGTALQFIHRTGMTAVSCALYCHSTCNTAEYDSQNQTCVTYQDNFYGGTLTQHVRPLRSILYSGSLVVYDGWIMVFRAQNGILRSVYDMWMSAGVHHDLDSSEEMPEGCLRLDNVKPCQRHFRSHLLDKWTGIKQVRFSLYKNGLEMQYVVFNGTNTSPMSWFHRAKILSSSWTTLKTYNSLPRYDLAGDIWEGSKRRFLSFGPYTYCASEYTYHMVIDMSRDTCESQWNLNFSQYPVFVYSPLDKPAILPKKEFDLADVMAVFVKI